MHKILKILNILLFIIYIIFIFLLIINNKKITSSFHLPTFLIPSIFFVSFLFISYKYIILKIKEGELEGEMISIINHTFRTPLTSIIWNAKEIEQNITQNEKSSHLQQINNSATKVLNVVDILVGIKNVKNTSGYVFQAISMREIIEQSLKKYRDNVNKKNITFQVSTLKDIPLLTVDLNKISFVIDTLIENAISYTKEGGKILIDCISNSEKLTLFISDTGIGLKFLDKIMIFSKFYRSKQAKLINTDGMGLRLYLSKEIIKRHSGKIYAKSHGSNKGSTFFIELPFHR
jgi:signal transduction histidine kinase